MKLFFDTSVLVAALQKDHQHHTQAWPVYHRVLMKKDEGFMSAHSIAEFYSTLTRLPVQPRIYPDEAARMINVSLLPHFETVPATMEDYRQALEQVSRNGWFGAKIYDMLLLVIAAKCKAERIYTFDLDFRRIAPAELQEKICAP